MYVAVTVTDNAPIGSVSCRTHTADEVPLGRGNKGDRDRLYAHEDEDPVKGREVSDKPGEVCGDAGGEVGEDKADAGDTGYA